MKIIRSMPFFLILQIILLISFFSCVGSGNKDVTKENMHLPGKPETVPVAKEKKAITLSGFGYAHTIDKKMAETWARNNALASLAEQGNGITFEYKVASNELKLTAASDEIFSGISQPDINSVFQNGKYWDAFVIYNSKVEIEIPAGYKTESINIQNQWKNIQNLIPETSRKALNTLSASLNPQPTALSGKIYLQELEVIYDKDKKAYAVNLLYLLIYNSL